MHRALSFVRLGIRTMMRKDAEVPIDVADPSGDTTLPPATEGHGAASALAPLRNDASARRNARTRAARAWARYLAELAVVLLVIASCVGWLWERGEYRHAHEHVATVAARDLPRAPLRAQLVPAWRSSDHAVLADPVNRDVVATYGGPTVTGRDADTGAVRWSYTRTDRRLCSAVTENAVVMAIYAHDGICDEATGLDATTGRVTWTRTLFGDGSDVTVVGGLGYYLLVRPGSVNLVHAGQGLAGIDAWNDLQPTGCRTVSAVLGNSGVLFLSACPGGNKLTLHKLDGDKRTWTVAAGGRTPLSADSGLLVLAHDGRSVEALSAKKGTVTARVTLRTSAAPTAVPHADQLSDVETEIVGVAGGALGISTGAPPVLRWQQRTGLLNVTTDDGVLTADAGAVYSVAPDSGRRRKVSVAPGVASGARLWSLGGGLLADSAGGVTAYS